MATRKYLIAIGCLQTAGGLVAAESNGVFNTPRTIYPADTRLALAALVAVTAAAMTAEEEVPTPGPAGAKNARLLARIPAAARIGPECPPAADPARRRAKRPW